MYKKTIVLILGLVIASAVIGMLWHQKKENIDNESRNVTLGALVPITGQLTVIGENMRNGMSLAKEDLIANGTVKNLTIIYEDACSEATSLVSTRKLIETDRIKVIASSFCLFGQDAIMSLTEANKVIIFNTTANSESLLNKKQGISTYSTVAYEGEKLAEYAYYILNARTAAIIYLDSSFGAGYRDAFTKQFETLGGKVLFTQTKRPISEDFKAPLIQIKNKQPDVLFIAHFGASLGYAIKQAKAIGIKSIILGEYESEDTNLIRLTSGTTENMIISSPESAIKTKKMIGFDERYQEKFGKQPDLLASNAYDGVVLQVTAFVACKGNADCMVKKLEKIKSYAGVSGIITINQANYF